MEMLEAAPPPDTALMHPQQAEYSPVAEAEAILSQNTPELSRRRVLIQKGIARAALEGFGMVVDTALMGAGSAGVNALQSVTTREVVATTGDIAIMDRLNNRGTNSEEAAEAEVKHPSRLRRIGRKAGELALGITTAIVAQKYGPEAVEHVNSTLNQGAGEVAVPLLSKVGALTGVNAAIGRLSR